MALGRTNAPSFISGGGTTIIDLPAPPSSINARAGYKTAYIDLTYSSTELLTGIELRYKTDSYPSSITDGIGMTVVGSPATIIVPDLEIGSTYYFRVYLYREIDGTKYYQTSTVDTMASVPIVAVLISGATPAYKGDNYALFDQSTSFTLTAYTNISMYVVGNGANGNGKSTTTAKYGCKGGDGGYVYKVDIPISGTVNCTTSIAAVSTTLNTTTIDIDGTSYSSSSGTHTTGGNGGRDSSIKNGVSGISTPYGYVGSSGGGGGYFYSKRDTSYNPGSGGIGAGDGGFSKSQSGNPNGKKAINYGCGGGGSGAYEHYYEDSENTISYGEGGAGKQGCVIITW